MHILLVAVNSTANLLLWVMSLAMLLRALFSWIPGTEESFFGALLYTLTEPLIFPMRLFVQRLRWDNLPIDVAFYFTFLILSLLRFIVPVVQ